MNENKLIKKGVWVYFLLLLFEGAIRKWMLPGLSTPLLIIRDPVALWVIFMVWRQGDFPRSAYVIGIVLIGVTAIFTAVIFGHGNIAVAIYGARILLIQFPFMFAMGKILDRNDVLKMGRALLYISIPMAVLIAFQFFSPQNALVNRGVGGDMKGAGFSGALGFFCPSGTFSFTNGISSYFSLVAAFVIYFWLNPSVNRIVLIGSSAAVVAAIPLSISRALLFTIIFSILFAILAISRNGAYVKKIAIASLVIVIGLGALSQVSFFRTATDAYAVRFENANQSEGGVKGSLGDRYMGGLFKALLKSGESPFLGQGIGLGTNVGSLLISGQRKYLISEDEWGRLIGEMGALMGLAVIFIRLGFSLKLFICGYKRMVDGDLLPWMLLSFGLLIIPQGQWAQPTNLGFSTLIVGLLIASLNNTRIAELEYTVIKKVDAGFSENSTQQMKLS